MHAGRFSRDVFHTRRQVFERGLAAGGVHWPKLVMGLLVLLLAGCGVGPAPEPTLLPWASPTPFPTVDPRSPRSRLPAAELDLYDLPGVAPVGDECPAEAQIKGNISANGWIYHVPGSRYYRQTHPETCFATVGEARAAGFRAPRR